MYPPQWLHGGITQPAARRRGGTPLRRSTPVHAKPQRLLEKCHATCSKTTSICDLSLRWKIKCNFHIDLYVFIQKTGRETILNWILMYFLMSRLISCFLSRKKLACHLKAKFILKKIWKILSVTSKKIASLRCEDRLVLEIISLFWESHEILKRIQSCWILKLPLGLTDRQPKWVIQSHYPLAQTAHSWDDRANALQRKGSL